MALRFIIVLRGEHMYKTTNEYPSKDTIILRKKFFNYLTPSVTAMWIYCLYSLVAGIFVGKGVGPSALAAINISAPFINYIFATSMLFSTGASTVISIYVGEGNLHKANEVFTFNMICMLVTSIVILVLSLIYIENIALFLGATKETLAMVKIYLRIIIICNSLFIVSYCLEILTKIDGSPHLAIIGMVLSGCLNILLNYIFIITLNLGVKGAALATVIAQGASCLFFLGHFLRKSSRLSFVKFHFSLKTLRRILSIGFPDAITELTSGIIVLLFNKIILKYIGENGMITYSVICYINSLVIMTMIGITQGIQPLSSYYYGKKQKNAIKALLKMSLKTITAFSVVIFLICIVFAKPIVALFISRNNGLLFTTTVMDFRIYSLCFLVLGYNVLISGFFAAIEKPMNALIISLSKGLVIAVIVLFLMTKFFGAAGIWPSTFISEILCLGISGALLLKGKPSPKIISANKNYEP